MGARAALLLGLLAALALALAPAAARGDSASEKAIEALRRDPSLKVRAQAALVLGQRGALEAVPALVAALARDDAAAVRIAAAVALGKIGDPAGREALDAARRADPDPQVRDAAARALADVGRVRPGSLHLEEVQGKGGDPAHQAFGEALARHLAERGFALVGAGDLAAYRVKPAVLALDVAESGGVTIISVRASAVAVDGQGRMAAMLEGSARLRASGASRAAHGRLSAQALDAAARTLADDMAARLK